MKRLAAGLVELWIALGLYLCLGLACAAQPHVEGYRGVVVDVAYRTSRNEGEPVVVITLGWDVVGPEGNIYEQRTIEYPLRSREGLMSRRGQCVVIDLHTDPPRLGACED